MSLLEFRALCVFLVFALLFYSTVYTTEFFLQCVMSSVANCLMRFIRASLVSCVGQKVCDETSNSTDPGCAQFEASIGIDATCRHIFNSPLGHFFLWFVWKYSRRFHDSLIPPCRTWKSSCCTDNTKFYSKHWIIHSTALPSVTMRCEVIIDSDINTSLNAVGGLTYELQVQLETRVSNFLVKK